MLQGCNISRKINTISTFIAMLWFYSDVSVLKWVGSSLNLILKRYVTRPEYDYECVLVSFKSYDHIHCLHLFWCLIFLPVRSDGFFGSLIFFTIDMLFFRICLDLNWIDIICLSCLIWVKGNNQLHTAKNPNKNTNKSPPKKPNTQQPKINWI